MKSWKILLQGGVQTLSARYAHTSIEYGIGDLFSQVFSGTRAFINGNVNVSGVFTSFAIRYGAGGISFNLNGSESKNILESIVK